MRVNYQNAAYDAAGFSETESAPIQSKQSAKLFYILTSGFYSEPVASMVREIISNALDEAQFADKPLRITMPSALNPQFIVRDYGRGMTHEFMLHRSMSLGDSTKDDSDEFIGGFGLGMKTPFVVTDQFAVTIFRGDHAQTYIIDKHGGLPRVMTDKSMIAPCDGETGTEIRIAFDVKCVAELREALQRFLPYVPAELYELESGIVKPVEYVRSGKAFKVTKERGESYILLGPVRYPINWRAVFGVEHYGMREAGKNQLALLFKPGELEVTPQREQIKWTQKSIAVVKARMKEAQEELIAEASAQIASAKTPWEAFTLARKIREDMGELAPEKIQWQGLAIPQYAKFRGYWSASKLRSQKTSKFESGTIDIASWTTLERFTFIIDDTSDRKTARAKALAESERDCSHIVCVEPLAAHLFGIPARKLSAIDPPAIKRDGSKFKGVRRCYSWKRYGATSSDADTAKGGLYVPFKGSKIDPEYENLHASILLSEFVYRLSPTIYGLPEAFRNQADMTLFVDAAEALRDEAKAEQKRLAAQIAWERACIDDDFAKLCACVGKTGCAEFDALWEIARKKPAYDKFAQWIVQLEDDGVLPKTAPLVQGFPSRYEAFRKANPLFDFVAARACDESDYKLAVSALKKGI